MITASAPGKLMLAGEYAVVAGHGPALAVALDARAVVCLAPGGDGWRVSSVGLGLEEAPIDAVPVLAAGVRQLSDALPAGGHLSVTSELGAGPDKPGLGGSAAVCVAGLGALSALAGLAQPNLDQAVRVHRTAQGGRGSGYDVATALHGGVCTYRNDGSAPTASSVQWLDGLHAAVLFTGRGAKTIDHLSRLHAAQARGAAERWLRDLGEASATMLKAWEQRSPSAVLASAANVERALDALDEACDLGIRGGGVQEARQAIEATGAVARTSGAGGGDCLWALAADEAGLQAAVEAAEEAGCRRLDVGWPGRGLEVTG